MLVYTVKRGDTLWQIAKGYQISLDALLRANPHLGDLNNIMPGDKINVPRLQQTEPPKGPQAYCPWEPEPEKAREEDIRRTELEWQLMKAQPIPEPERGQLRFEAEPLPMPEPEPLPAPLPKVQPLPQPEIQPLPQPEVQPLPQPEVQAVPQPLPQPEVQPLVEGAMERATENPYEEMGIRPCILITSGGETLHSISEEWDISLSQLHYHNYQYALDAQLPGGERIIMPKPHDYHISLDQYQQPRMGRRRRYR